MQLSEYRDQLRQGSVIVGLLVILCVVLIYHFTEHTAEGAQRERIHIMLRRIVDLELAYYKDYGTYLSIDCENNGDVLQLNGETGRFRYWVTVSDDGFSAYAESDFDFDGQVEIWMVDGPEAEPMLIQRD